MREFQAFCQKIAKPFKWKYTEDDLKKSLERLDERGEMVEPLRLAA